MNPTPSLTRRRTVLTMILGLGVGLVLVRGAVAADYAGTDPLPVRGRVYVSPSAVLPAGARLRVSVYAGSLAPESDAPLGMVESGHLVAGGDNVFEGQMKVPSWAMGSTIRHEVIPRAETGPGLRIFEQVMRSSTSGEGLNDLVVVVYATADTAASLRDEAEALARRLWSEPRPPGKGWGPELATRLFQAADAVSTTDGQRLETCRVHARTILAVRGNPVEALTTLAWGAGLEGFIHLPDRVRHGYWTERLDYFERMAFLHSPVRDRSGAFATAIATHGFLHECWRALVRGLEFSPPRQALLVSLSSLPDVVRQDRAVSMILAGRGRPVSTLVRDLRRAGVDAWDAAQPNHLREMESSLAAAVDAALPGLDEAAQEALCRQMVREARTLDTQPVSAASSTASASANTASAAAKAPAVALDLPPGRVGRDTSHRHAEAWPPREKLRLLLAARRHRALSATAEAELMAPFDAAWGRIRFRDHSEAEDHAIRDLLFRSGINVARVPLLYRFRYAHLKTFYLKEASPVERKRLLQEMQTYPERHDR